MDDIDELFNSLSNQIENTDETDLSSLIDKITTETATDTKPENYCYKCKTTKSVIKNLRKGEYMCTGCGLVTGSFLHDIIDSSNFDDKKADCYAGKSNALIPGASLGTKFGGKGGGRVRRLHNWGAYGYKTRCSNQEHSDIELKCQQYNIEHNVIHGAKILYNHISNSKKHNLKDKKEHQKQRDIIIRGTNRQGIKAACVFYSAKQQKKPRSTSEIAKIFGITRKDVSTGIRKFHEINNFMNYIKHNISCTPIDYIDTYSKKLRSGFGLKQIKLAKKICGNVEKLNIANDHQPSSIAIVSILLVAEICEIDEIDKKLLTKLFEISEVTVIKTYDKISTYRKIIVNNERTDELVSLLKKELQKDNKKKRKSKKKKT